jgi:hypothetical protein
MQRVCDYVRTGHQAYISGVTDTSKIFNTWEKLVRKNPVFDDKLKAFRARERGEATGRLLLYQNPRNPEKIFWFLLVNGKKEQLPKGENWKHAEDHHNRIYFTGYELVRVTKEGLKKPVWTWRYTRERYEDLRDSMVLSIRSNRDHDFKNLIQKIFGTMGFSGSREQAKNLANLAKEEWKRRRQNDEMPEIPKGIGWIRRKEDKGVFLTRENVLNVVKKVEEDKDSEHVESNLLEEKNDKVDEGISEENFNKFTAEIGGRDASKIAEDLFKSINDAKRT